MICCLVESHQIQILRLHLCEQIKMRIVNSTYQRLTNWTHQTNGKNLVHCQMQTRLYQKSNFPNNILGSLNKCPSRCLKCRMKINKNLSALIRVMQKNWKRDYCLKLASIKYTNYPGIYRVRFSLRNHVKERIEKRRMKTTLRHWKRPKRRGKNNRRTLVQGLKRIC